MCSDLQTNFRCDSQFQKAHIYYFSQMDHLIIFISYLRYYHKKRLLDVYMNLDKSKFVTGKDTLELILFLLNLP